MAEGTFFFFFKQVREKVVGRGAPPRCLPLLQVLCLPQPAPVLGNRVSVGHAEEVCVEDERAAEWAVKENYVLIIEKHTGLSLGSQAAVLSYY